MDSHDFSLCLQHLGLTAAEFAALIGDDIDRVHRWISGAEAVPHTIDLLTYYWCELPGALEMAQEASEAHSAPDETLPMASGSKGLRSLQ